MTDEPTAEMGRDFWLAACDEALAAGVGLAGLSTADPVADRQLSALALLHQTWPRREPPPPTSAPRLGRFELGERLGSGAFGTVYRARDPRLGRDVALKIAHPHLAADPDQRRRFLREGRAAAALDHPGIVAVHDLGEEGDTLYLAQAYCPGPTLADWLRSRSGPVGATEAATLAADLADALQHAHDRGVVHRDIKPANILLQESADGEKPRPKMTDFGLARLAAEAGPSLTHNGGLVGTPRYMAPEQAQGTDAGPAADIHALGAILYEMLAGVPPFQGDSVPEVLEQVRRHEPVAPSRLRPGLPRDLETVCLKCLRKEPENRYAGAADLAADLRRFLRGESVRARPVGPATAAWRWAKRNPRVALLMIAVASLLLILTAGAVTAAMLLAASRDRAEEAVKEGRERLWDSYLAQARAGQRSRQAGQRDQGLEALRLAAEIRPTPELRDEAISCLALADYRHDAGPPRLFDRTDGLYGREWRFDAEAGTIEVLDGGRRVIAWGDRDRRAVEATVCPEGRRAAVLFERGEELTVEVWDVAAARRTATSPQDRDSGAARGWADGGRLLYVVRGGVMAVIDPDRGETRREVPLSAATPVACGLHPDRKRLLILSRRGGEARVIDLTTGVETRIDAEIDADLVAWHPSGRRFAIAYDNGNDNAVAVHDFPSGERVWRLPRSSAITSLHFVDDGSVLAASNWCGVKDLLDAATGEILLRTPRFHAATIFHPEREDLAHSSAHGDEIVSLDCRRVLPVEGKLDIGPAGEFSPDGRLIAVRNGNRGVTLIDAATGLPLADLPVGICATARFSPDGSELFTFSEIGGLRAWPVSGSEFGSGEPRSLGVETATAHYSWLGGNRRGRLIASRWADGEVVLIDPALPNEKRTLPIRSPRSVALDPEGRYAAVGQWHDRESAVWDLKTGKPCLRFGDPAAEHFALSQDGRWLAADHRHGTEFYRVGEWGRPHRLIRSATALMVSCPTAFSGDGRFAAVRTDADRVILLRGDTLEAVAHFRTPESGVVGLALDPTGRQLLIATAESRVLWNLERVREHLLRMGLAFDWPAPARSPAAR